MKYGPDFICIGAQKAGTSWLHSSLLAHIDAAMPPEKEINFFYPAVLPSPWKRLLRSRTANLDTLWHKRYGKLITAWESLELDFPYQWYVRYLYGVRTMRQYIKLFPKYNNKITGDLSPSYIALTEAQIRQISEQLPNTKIIFLVRHPVERAWSAFKMDQASFIKTNPSEEELIQRMEYVTAHSKYCDVIDVWRKCAPDRLGVWFYEYLNENPEQFFGEICDFLSISPYRMYDRTQLRQKVFKGSGRPMPEGVRRYLNSMLEDEILGMHARFNNSYTAAWCASLSATAFN